MATIAEHEASMTIFYYKSDGTIYSYCTGISDMSSFGSRQFDYELIIDYVVLPRDNTVITFLNRFYVDVDTKELKLKSEYEDLKKYL